MKIKKKIIMGGLTVVMATAITAGSVYAAPHEFNQKKNQGNETLQQHDTEDLLVRHEAMEKAFADNDYHAWKELMKNNQGRVVQVINETNFAKFAEAHRLIKAGKLEEGKKILTDLGVMKKFTKRDPNKEKMRNHEKFTDKKVNKGKHLGLGQHKFKKNGENK